MSRSAPPETGSCRSPAWVTCWSGRDGGSPRKRTGGPPVPTLQNRVRTMVFGRDARPCASGGPPVPTSGYHRTCGGSGEDEPHLCHPRGSAAEIDVGERGVDQLVQPRTIERELARNPRRPAAGANLDAQPSPCPASDTVEREVMPLIEQPPHPKQLLQAGRGVIGARTERPQIQRRIEERLVPRVELSQQQIQRGDAIMKRAADKGRRTRRRACTGPSRRAWIKRVCCRPAGGVEHRGYFR
jgi:hypothetical protein